ncbi:MAG: 2-C-methyl-D-erythritol 4-phosphate cytidylyltransferase [Muribaculum sp.]|nr:2-C-methyl-D-erythritol 4-phosphate cytidylyltransferase [Muribaculaceae bacterium]MCM1080570.1 2-C-methyl-D-erythritol 4-phosphate cytidylyltransferase [Muribaculum sp.]
MENIAVILAGGTGSRLGAPVPKQFIHIAGVTILEHTLHRFDNNSRIARLCVVVHPDYVDETRHIIESARLQKKCDLLTGGKERYHSSLAAIKHYSEIYAADASGVNLLLHDAARALISEKSITEVVETLERHEAVCLAVPATDTIIMADSKGYIDSIPRRALLWNAQTPQGFRLSTISKAFQIGLADQNFFATDDCSVVKRYMPHVPIKIVRGEPTNIKLTYSADIEQFERSLKK